MWKVVETEAGKTRVAKTKRRRKEGRSGKKERGKSRKKGKAEEEKDDGSEESGRGIGDLE